jgi:hypothetical protein
MPNGSLDLNDGRARDRQSEAFTTGSIAVSRFKHTAGPKAFSRPIGPDPRLLLGHAEKVCLVHIRSVPLQELTTSGAHELQKILGLV